MLRGQQYPRKIFTPTIGEEMPIVGVQILYEILYAIQITQSYRDCNNSFSVILEPGIRISQNSHNTVFTSFLFPATTEFADACGRKTFLRPVRHTTRYS